jgi:glycolate oxidase FAD binding subunit
VSTITTRSIGAAFRAVTGADRVIEDSDTLAGFAVDHVVPRWVVRPSAVDQLAAVMTVAAEERLAVAARGNGAALDLGAPPSRLDVVVDLADLDAIVEYNADDLTVTVQAGLPLDALNHHLQAHRQFLPLDPPGGHTVGGIAATGLSGPLRFRYGTMRDLLLGVRFVQADGVVTWGGSKVVKSVTGYDVPKLMVSALGTLGILAELTLRLHSRPEAEGTWFVRVPSMGVAETLVNAMLDSTLQPSRIELLDAFALHEAALPVAAAALLVSFGSVPEAVAEQGDRLTQLAHNAGGAARAVKGDWTVSTRRPDETRTTLRVGALPARLVSTYGMLARALQRLGDAARGVTAHAGLGVWHVVIDSGTPEAIAKLIEELRAGVAADGGYVVITGGPAAVRRHIDPWGPIPDDVLTVMRSVKATFDPDNRLNPGRFVGGL